MRKLGYINVLKLNKDTGQFSPDERPESDKMESIVPEFFGEASAGIHVLIICTGEEDKVTAEEFAKVLNEKCSGRLVVVCDKYQLPSKGECPNVAGVVNENEDVLGALKSIHEFVEQIEPKEDPEAFEELYSSIKTSQKYTKGSNKHKKGFKEEVATGFEKLWDILESSKDMVPEIRLIVYLPKDIYETFTYTENYFPTQMEFVLQAVSEEEYREYMLEQLKRRHEEELEKKDVLIRQKDEELLEEKRNHQQTKDELELEKREHQKTKNQLEKSDKKWESLLEIFCMTTGSKDKNEHIEPELQSREFSFWDEQMNRLVKDRMKHYVQTLQNNNNKNKMSTDREEEER